MKAIILAAGLGTRLRPLTDDKPKCLVPVNGTPMVERQLQFLREAGITEITIVSGYRAEKLAYLKDMYGVDIVHNERYASGNNILSMYKVLDRLGDHYAIDGDTWLQANPFLTPPEKSMYFSAWHDEYVQEWGLSVDGDRNLIGIEIGRVRGYIMSGVSYWTEKDALLLAGKIREAVERRHRTDIFWDNIVVENCRKMDIAVREFNAMFEIDSERDLRELERRIENGLI